jgi:mono/diheme cytochrome c family protein
MLMMMAAALLWLFGNQAPAAPAANQAPAQPRRTAPRAAPIGTAAAGKAYWELPTTFCNECHGAKAQGAYGPDLAGRQLSFEQFRHQVRTPWGAMPRWTPQQISDQTIADIRAYVISLPTVETPGPWGKPVPPKASQAVRYFTESYGCAQCHGTDIKPVLLGPVAGTLDFARFKQVVYRHDTAFPAGRMGSFSPDRLPESVLRVIWNAVPHVPPPTGARGK